MGGERKAMGKSVVVESLPFFDDFANTARSRSVWQKGGTLFNQGYAPLPPTIGMATLDAYDADGNLYPEELGQLYSADTLTSPVVRLDSAYVPYARSLSPVDSIYLSFFYLPGGGYGNMWERVGDVPEAGDSLVLEFYSPQDQSWHWVWGRGGISADTLLAQTGSYWQYIVVPITSASYFDANFQFRFRNYCSLDNASKKGILSNADQWNIDCVYINLGRTLADTAMRDMAFVNPAPSLLRQYQAMPARQYQPSELKSNLDLTITNRFSQPLAYHYGYQIADANNTLHSYDGGFDNAPVYWNGYQYQQAEAHAHPQLDYTLPYPMAQPMTFTVTHVLREGVSGDPYPNNDTVVFHQVFDNYFAYDDGEPENGYGITSTYSKVKVACRFQLAVEDTLTAVLLYFNHTYRDQNDDVRFLLTVWDDNDGRPGNIIYQDHTRRRPAYAGLNQYVRYILEDPVVCQGTIYVGWEQTSADFINLGFDRNNDASEHTFYLADSHWQQSILRGAIMLRPYFGQKATVGIADITDHSGVTVKTQGSRIVIDQAQLADVAVFDMMGRCVYSARGISMLTPPLPSGVYWVRVGTSFAKKIIIL